MRCCPCIGRKTVEAFEQAQDKKFGKPSETAKETKGLLDTYGLDEDIEDVGEEGGVTGVRARVCVGLCELPRAHCEVYRRAMTFHELDLALLVCLAGCRAQPCVCPCPSQVRNSRSRGQSLQTESKRFLIDRCGPRGRLLGQFGLVCLTRAGLYASVNMLECRAGLLCACLLCVRHCCACPILAAPLRAQMALTNEIDNEFDDEEDAASPPPPKKK